MSNNVYDLTPTEDQWITIRKYGREISFPDRIPAGLVPSVMRIMHEDGSIEMSQENIDFIFSLVGRIATRANPEMSADDVLFLLDIDDLPFILQRLLNPKEPLSDTTTPEPSPTPTSTRKRRNS